MLCSQLRIGSIFYPTVSFAYLDLDLAGKKLAKGKCVAKQARDKEQALEILVGIGGCH